MGCPRHNEVRRWEFPEDALLGALAAWNVLCVPLEWFTIASLYNEHPSLAVRKEPKSRQGYAGSRIRDTYIGLPELNTVWGSSWD